MSGRWWVLAVFVLSSAINYLDRQSLATLAPLVRTEFHLTNAEFGWIVTAFSVTYALAAPLAGMFIDRVGLTIGIYVAVAVWSAANIACGLTSGLTSLVICRAVLGLGEAGGIPAAGRAIRTYLEPAERALGNAVNQAGVSLGLVLAPPIATWIAVTHGWRTAFVVTGIFGLLWIPLWRRAATKPDVTGAVSTAWGLLGEPQMWGFIFANAMSMVIYSLWTNWTTLYLVDVLRMNLQEAAWYAWIPPAFATVGGFAGGAASMRLMRGGMPAIPARIRTCLFAAVLCGATALVPLFASAAWAAALISVSMFAVAAFSVNMYTLPLDAFGERHTAFAVSLLVSAYGGIQALISPAFGALIDEYGYAPVCRIAAALPILAYGVLRWTESDPS